MSNYCSHFLLLISNIFLVSSLLLLESYTTFFCFLFISLLFFFSFSFVFYPFIIMMILYLSSAIIKIADFPGLALCKRFLWAEKYLNSIQMIDFHNASITSLLPNILCLCDTSWNTSFPVSIN